MDAEFFGSTLDEVLARQELATAEEVDRLKNEILNRQYRRAMLLEGAIAEGRKAQIGQARLDALCSAVTSQHQAFSNKVDAIAKEAADGS